MAQLGSTPPQELAHEQRLESWKEIAAYLKKSVRTVQDWEKKEGLPVHRRVHDKLGTVYAYRAELDAWWQNGHGRLEAKEADEAEEAKEKGRRWRVAGAVAAAAIVVAAAIAWWWPRTPVLPFAQRDWVLIAQFENQTREDVFNGTLEHALERELSNSRFVNVVPRERVNDSLLLMRKPLDTPLTAAVGREVCLRDGGIRALLTGRVEKLDSTYLLSVALVNPASGVTVRSFSEEAAGQKQVIPALRGLSSQVRAALGEALPEIRKSEQALEKVTTPSLRALQLFSQADALIAQSLKEQKPAEELLRQAIAEDPDFASAYMHLAHAIRNQGRPPEDYRPHAQRALELSERVSERERYFIRGGYSSMKGDEEKALIQYQSLVQRYPDHYWGNNNLAWTLERLGRSEEAVQYHLGTADARPNDFVTNARAVRALIENKNHFAQARPYYDRAQALLTPETLQRFPGLAAWVETFPVWEHLSRGEVPSALDLLALLEKRIEPATGDSYVWQIGSAYCEIGKLRKSEEIFAHFKRDNDRYYFTSWVDYSRGDWKTFREHMKLAAGRNNYAPADVDWFARAGLLADARQALAVMEGRKRPEGYLALARGYLAQAEGKTDEATKLFEKARQEWEPKHSWQHAQASAALARIREKQGNQRQAIELLEPIRAQRSRLFLVLSTVDWVDSQMHLASLYRKVGREREAEVIEDELRKLLVYADADHALARELRQTQKAEGRASSVAAPQPR